MKSIYKYKLNIVDEQTIKGNIDYILCAKEQDGGLCIWAVVNSELTEKEITIRIVGTGHPFPDEGYCVFIDTVVVSYGGFVWHIFEKLKE